VSGRQAESFGVRGMGIACRGRGGDGDAWGRGRDANGTRPVGRGGAGVQGLKWE
jgi:hypothetical protein